MFKHITKFLGFTPKYEDKYPEDIENFLKLTTMKAEILELSGLEPSSFKGMNIYNSHRELIRTMDYKEFLMEYCNNEDNFISFLLKLLQDSDKKEEPKINPISWDNSSGVLVLNANKPLLSLYKHCLFDIEDFESELQPYSLPDNKLAFSPASKQSNAELFKLGCHAVMYNKIRPFTMGFLVGTCFPEEPIKKYVEDYLSVPSSEELQKNFNLSSYNKDNNSDELSI